MALDRRTIDAPTTTTRRQVVHTRFTHVPSTFHRASTAHPHALTTMIGMKKLLSSLLVLGCVACAREARHEPPQITCDAPTRRVEPLAPMPSGIHLGPPEGEHYWNGTACVTVGEYQRVGHGGDPWIRLQPAPVVAFPDRASCEVAHAHCA